METVRESRIKRSAEETSSRLRRARRLSIRRSRIVHLACVYREPAGRAASAQVEKQCEEIVSETRLVREMVDDGRCAWVKRRTPIRRLAFPGGDRRRGRLAGSCFPLFWVDILPGGAHIRVTCLPKMKRKGWNDCRARWIC